MMSNPKFREDVMCTSTERVLKLTCLCFLEAGEDVDVACFVAGHGGVMLGCPAGTCAGASILTHGAAAVKRIEREICGEL